MDRKKWATYQLSHRDILRLIFSDSSVGRISWEAAGERGEAPMREEPSETYLASSAALSPAPVTMTVCGEPFSSGASPSVFGVSACASRNAGKFSRLRGEENELESLMAFADFG